VTRTQSPAGRSSSYTLLRFRSMRPAFLPGMMM